MPFDLLHRPSRKRGRNPWYENALLIAVAGSIIAVIGQLSGTVIPIMFGPQDFSDFSLLVDPVYLDTVNFGENNAGLIGEVYVRDLHSFIRPYRFEVYLKALQVPAGVKIRLVPPIQSPGGTSDIDVYWAPDVAGEFPIIIQGVGGDGRTRNATLYISLKAKNESLRDLGTPSMGTFRVGLAKRFNQW